MVHLSAMKKSVTTLNDELCSVQSDGWCCRSWRPPSHPEPERTDVQLFGGRSFLTAMEGLLEGAQYFALSCWPQSRQQLSVWTE